MNDLSLNEKIVMYALSCFPLSSDRYIAEKFGYNVSTFTSIKNRLKRTGYFNIVQIPAFWKIGYEIFNINWGKFRKNFSDTFTDIDHAIPMAIGLGENFHVSIEFDQYLTMNISREFTNTFRTIEDFMINFAAMGYFDSKNFHTLTLPFHDMIIWNFFDSKWFLYKSFDLDETDDWKDNMSQKEIKSLTTMHSEKIKVEMNNPTPMEMKILYGISRYPEWPDNKISKIIGATRQTVSRVKKNLLKRNLLKTVVCPNLKMLGYDMLVFNILHQPVTDTKFNEAFIHLANEYPPLLMLRHNMDNILYIPYKTFGDYRKATNLIKNEVNNPISEGNYEIAFSLQNIVFERKHAYYYSL